LDDAARPSGITIRAFRINGPGEWEQAFSKVAREGALFVIANPALFIERKHIADLALKHRLPSVVGGREYAEAGGLVSYAVHYPDLFRRAASYVDKILKGAQPAELPIEQPVKYELVINLKTAKALGLTIPQSLLVRADEIIQ
jgi:putative tryptophan/tyrosine transport system substrate-binding protein